MELSGRIAVVTGGGSGIGRGIALGLAAEGMSVAVLDVDGESAGRVAAEIGRDALPIEADVTSSDALEAAAAAAVDRFGAVNVLAANAGVMPALAPLAETTAQDWEFVFSVNVFGVVKTVQAFLPQLRAAAPNAHIVSTASLGGLVAVEGYPLGIYVASKYACVGYTESLRGELSNEGIGVSVLCPGMVRSNLGATSVRNRPGRLGSQPMPVAEAPADLPGMMRAEDVGPIVARGIRENRLHILTHPRARAMVAERFARIAADFDFAEALEA